MGEVVYGALFYWPVKRFRKVDCERYHEPGENYFVSGSGSPQFDRRVELSEIPSGLNGHTTRPALTRSFPNRSSSLDLL